MLMDYLKALKRALNEGNKGVEKAILHDLYTLGMDNATALYLAKKIKVK